MINSKTWYAFEKATTAGEKETANNQGETLILQVMGTASSVSLQVLGQVDFLSSEWSALTTVNMTTLDTNTIISKKGVYMVPIEGCSKIKVLLNSVAGGEATVFCKITQGV